MTERLIDASIPFDYDRVLETREYLGIKNKYNKEDITTGGFLKDPVKAITEKNLVEATTKKGFGEKIKEALNKAIEKVTERFRSFVDRFGDQDKGRGGR